MLNPQQLFDHLAELGIAHRTVEHPPVFTVEEAKALRGNLAGHHVKNLFLRNKKEEMWLVVALEDQPIDLTIDGRPHQKSCQVVLLAGMVVQCDE